MRPMYLLTHSFNQPPPTKQMWHQWKRFLHIIIYPNSRLRHPLGHWLVSPADQRCNWHSYFSPSRNILYVNVISGRVQFVHCEKSSQYIHDAPSPKVPDNAIPVMMELHDNKSLQLHTPSHYHMKSPPMEAPGIQSNIHLHVNNTVLSNVLSLGAFLAASDGSVHNKNGTFRWILRKGDTVIAEGSGFAPNLSPSSFHAEACGILSLLQWLASAPLHAPPNINITIAIDNQSLVHQMAAHASNNLQKMNDSLLASWVITQ